MMPSVIRGLGLRGSQTGHMWEAHNRAVRWAGAWGKHWLLEGVRCEVWCEVKSRG